MDQNLKRFLFLATGPFLLIAVTVGCGGNSGSDTPDAGPSSPNEVTAADIGPVQSVDLGPIDASLAQEGETLFGIRCITCHKLDERYIGPPLRDITERRDPVFFMNMVLNPEGMLAQNKEVQALFAEYSVPMINQNLSEQEARAILEYLRRENENQ